MPCRRCANAVPLDMHVQQVRPAVCRRTLRTFQRRLKLRRLGNNFSFYTESRCQLRIIDVWISEVAGHVAAGLELPSADVPDAVAFIIVGAVIANDDGDRCLVPGITPERLRAGKEECAVPDYRHNRQVGMCQFYTESCRQSPSQCRSGGSEVLLV